MNEINKIILCPVNSNLRNAPGHLLFASNYFEEVALKELGQNVIVKYLYYKQNKYTKKQIFILNIKLLWQILKSKHDAVYFGTDPLNLSLLSVLAALNLYRKPIYAWKYTIINSPSNLCLKILKKYIYKGFSKLFMITENHVYESIKEGVVNDKQLMYMKWGEDLRYVDKLKKNKEEKFTFISTGKAYRDFKTLCEAFSFVQNANLKIIVQDKWGDFNYKDYLDTIKNPAISIRYASELKNSNFNILDYIFNEMHTSHCALSICQEVKFGVGYTQILDSMACSLPVIATWNKDNPINLEKEKIGFHVIPRDIDGLAKIMNKLVNNPLEAAHIGNNGRRLIEQCYNIKIVAKEVLTIILHDLNKPN